MVLAYNEETGKNEFMPVLEIFENEDPAITYLTLEDDETTKFEAIITTPGHPFYLEVNVDNTDRPAPQGHEELAEPWVGAGDLKTGDKVRQADGTTGTVRTVMTLEETKTMYNLDVSTLDNFYVGEQGWLVHNQNGVGSSSPSNPWTFNPSVDLDMRGSGSTWRDALSEAFSRTGVPREAFTETKWSYSLDGKSFPTEWRVLDGSYKGAEVSMDFAHTTAGPEVPHFGYQTPGKRATGGAVRGHILIDGVPCGR